MRFYCSDLDEWVRDETLSHTTGGTIQELYPGEDAVKCPECNHILNTAEQEFKVCGNCGFPEIKNKSAILESC